MWTTAIQTLSVTTSMVHLIALVVKDTWAMVYNALVGLITETCMFCIVSNSGARALAEHHC